MRLQKRPDKSAQGPRWRPRVLGMSLCNPGLMCLLPSVPITIVRVALGSASWGRGFRGRRSSCAGKVSLEVSRAQHDLPKVAARKGDFSLENHLILGEKPGYQWTFKSDLSPPATNVGAHPYVYTNATATPMDITQGQFPSVTWQCLDTYLLITARGGSGVQGVSGQRSCMQILCLRWPHRE